MPTITNPGVIEALTTAYLLNGCNQAAAGIELGYSETYVYNGEYSKLFERQDVLAEIRKQRLDLAKKTGFTKEQASVDLDESRELAMKQTQPSAATAATVAKMRLYGMDQPEAKKDATVIIINPPTQPTARPLEVIDAERAVINEQPQNGLNEATGDDNEV